MPVFDVSTHGLLSEAINEVKAPMLEAHTLLAEKLLGLTHVYDNESDQETAELALALQIKHQLALGIDVDVTTVSSWGEDGSSVSYRDGIPIRNTTAVFLMGHLPDAKCLSERMGYKNTVRSNRSYM